ELQIVAYDGTYLTDLAGMKLTAVAQDFSAIAQSTADHIVQAIANEEVAAANASRRGIPKPFEPNVLIPMTLVPGDTTR
ncbi:MAG: LacI family transcriptional regulator, partial [Bifidobacterium breve]|nr:LacI family transcriptional regulator [Bifidobacterium breve]